VKGKNLLLKTCQTPVRVDRGGGGKKGSRPYKGMGFRKTNGLPDRQRGGNWLAWRSVGAEKKKGGGTLYGVKKKRWGVGAGSGVRLEKSKECNVRVMNENLTGGREHFGSLTLRNWGKSLL